ncbi:MAG TPA: hypothetical protein VIF34_05155 [Methylocystis sp.]|jgi:hypothetical protein
MFRTVLIAIAAILGTSGVASAQGYNYGTGSNSSDHYVSGHYNSNGGYTQPHYQTNPNGTTHDNYGAGGNYNYHTGRYGRGY